MKTQKLSPREQQEIVEAYAGGESQKSICARTGHDKSLISRTISRARQRAQEAAEIEALNAPAVDPKTGVTLETSDAELLRTMSRAVARDFYNTEDVGLRAHIAKTAAALLVARHKITTPVPATQQPNQPLEPEQPKDEGLLQFN